MYTNSFTITTPYKRFIIHCVADPKIATDNVYMQQEKSTTNINFCSKRPFFVSTYVQVPKHLTVANEIRNELSAVPINATQVCDIKEIYIMSIKKNF